MTPLHYLTVQDVLWINLQITKKVQHFNYARLEEAVFYQYAYGESNSLFPQAARFLSGFVKMRPFEAGSDATAFVSCLAFLSINGHTTPGSEADLRAWFNEATHTLDGDGVSRIASPDSEAHHGLVPDVRGTVRVILDRYAGLVGELSTAPAV